jgi:hypothetical protein
MMKIIKIIKPLKKKRWNISILVLKYLLVDQAPLRILCATDAARQYAGIIIDNVEVRVQVHPILTPVKQIFDYSDARWPKQIPFH